MQYPQDRQPPDAPLTDLAAMRPGAAGVIRAIEGEAALRRRLRHLGLRPGGAIRVVQKSSAGTVVSSRGLKLALAPAAARRVLIERDA